VQVTESIEIALDPDTVFAYVGNPEKLPQYLPRVVAARRTGSDVSLVLRVPGSDDTTSAAAQFQIKPSRRLEWDVADGRLHGEVVVDPTDAGSRIVVSLRTDGDGDYLATGRELAEALQQVKRTLERSR
jgi:uncharacterized protein YndB with AHSA1/START domain